MLKKYEIMYILDENTKEVAETQAKLNNILTTNGGSIIESEDWGLMNFSYEINHKKKGFYFVVVVNTTIESVNEFERISKIDKHVIRTMVLNTENIKNYVQSTKLSKTDMTKFEEERREKRMFKKPFNRANQTTFKKPVSTTEETNSNQN